MVKISADLLLNKPPTVGTVRSVDGVQSCVSLLYANERQDDSATDISVHRIPHVVMLDTLL